MNKEHDREFGFIKDDKDGIEYYFSLKAFKGDRKKVAISLKVEYFLEDGYDKKKERAAKKMWLISKNQINFIQGKSNLSLPVLMSKDILF